LVDFNLNFIYVTAAWLFVFSSFNFFINQATKAIILFEILYLYNLYFKYISLHLTVPGKNLYSTLFAKIGRCVDSIDVSNVNFVTTLQSTRAGAIDCEIQVLTFVPLSLSL